MSDAPLIVTLRLDAAAFTRLNDLRRVFFPPERNSLSAHLTLFHHLPGKAEGQVLGALRDVASSRPPLALQVEAPFSLGRGVAFRIASPELKAVRATLLQGWEECFPDTLTAQDRQGFRPHVTVQNKAEPADARALLAELTAAFEPWPATGEAIQLWRYLGGPWKAAGEAQFATK